MRKTYWLIPALIGVLFAALLAYGIHQGDPAYVLKNAANFCFS